MTKEEKVGVVSGGRPALVYLVPFPGAQFRPEHTPPCKYHPPLWSLSSRSVLHVSQGSALKTIELPAEHLSRKEIHQNIGRSWEISQTGQIIQLQGNIAEDLVPQKSSHRTIHMKVPLVPWAQTLRLPLLQTTIYSSSPSWAIPRIS